MPAETHTLLAARLTQQRMAELRMSLRSSTMSNVVIELDLFASAAIILYGLPNGSIPSMCLEINTRS